MRVWMSCPYCSFQNPHERRVDVDVGELSDEGVATGDCSRGHTIHVLVQSTQHELLFDSACSALLDGYYREAIGSFAASLERFHEFATRVMAKHHGLAHDTIDQTWNRIARRSEAQLGAFLFLYALHTRAPAEPFALESTRNDIVHKGRIATKADALEFARACYERIGAITDKLWATAEHAVESVVDELVAARARNLRGGKPGELVSTYVSLASPVALGRRDQVRRTFEQALEDFSRWAPWQHPADRVTLAALARSFELDIDKLSRNAGTPEGAQLLGAALKSVCELPDSGEKHG